VPPDTHGKHWRSHTQANLASAPPGLPISPMGEQYAACLIRNIIQFDPLVVGSGPTTDGKVLEGAGSSEGDRWLPSYSRFTGEGADEARKDLLSGVAECTI
jgi:hypothetical protein